ncbi:hypothetical protein CXG81DRAFT_6252, partial [Caulochytrium protostelioides]
QTKATSSKTQPIGSHRAACSTLGWSCDGRRLASGGADKTALLWSNDTSGRAHAAGELRGAHHGALTALAWAPDAPERLVTAGADGLAVLWDTRASTTRAVAQIHTHAPNVSLAWRHDGHVVAVANAHDAIALWDLRRGPEHVVPQTVGINEVCFTPDGARLLAATTTGGIRVLDAATLALEETLPAHRASCLAVDIDRRQRYVATGGADGLVTLWDLAARCCVSALSSLAHVVDCVRFSANGDYVAAGSADASILVAHTESGATFATLPIPQACKALAWHPLHPILAYA